MRFIDCCKKGDLDQAQSLYNSDINIREAFLVSCKFGYIVLAKWLYSLGKKVNIRDAFITSCEYGQLNVAIWLHSQGRKLDFTDALAVSCYTGKIEIAKWLTTLGVRKISVAFEMSCLGGHFEIAKWLYTLGEKININKAFCNSCSQGHVEIAQWLFRPEVNIISAFSECCINGHKNVAVWLHNLKSTHQLNIKNQLNIKKAFVDSCSGGHMDVAIWLNSLDDFSQKIKDQAFINSCINGHIELSKWLCTLCQFSPEIKNDAIRSSCKKLPISKWLYDTGTYSIEITSFMFQTYCAAGEIDLARSLYSKEVDVGRAFVLACKNKRTEIAKWLWEFCNNETIDCAFAASCGARDNIDLSQWLLSLGAKINNMAIYNACFCGDINTVNWLYKLGLRPEQIDNIFIVCCSKGNLNVIKWLHKLYSGIVSDFVTQGFKQSSDMLVAKWILKKYHTCINLNKFFSTCCATGKYKLANLLLKYGADIKYNNCAAFTNCCKYNEFKMVKWLYRLNQPDMLNHNVLTTSFKICCECRHHKIAKWLLGLNPKIIQDSISSLGEPPNYRKIGIIGQNAKLYECIRMKRPFPVIEDVDDCIIYCLADNNMIEELKTLSQQFQFITFNIEHNKVINLVINRFNPKRALF